MNSLNNQRGEEWDVCARCGSPFPMSLLRKQQGLLLCERDTDDLSATEERRQQVIASVLKSPEGIPEQHQNLAQDAGELTFE